MKMPVFLKPLVVAAVLANVGVASATMTTPVSVAANSTFSDVVLGTFVLGTVSNVIGTLGFIESGSLNFGTISIPVTFSSVSFSGSSLTGPFSATATGSTFSFSNLAAGTYTLKATGSVGSGIGGFIAADYNIAAVPEPASYAMFFAGLGLMGAVATRRRRNIG